MSQVRAHNFSISLDGYGTGEGFTLEAPFGHAGHRLHEWMFATRAWRARTGQSGGTLGVDDSFADALAWTTSSAISRTSSPCKTHRTSSRSSP